ncbi:putative ATP-binding cassette transporter [Xylaria bambusicola]|uniref:putative ATP-binding cassette transporter n=1 Tax=Xylaria bambusicola TaxID=326684 RepID=UPI002008973C|nr:putative ATP-binding cassette transporter [Xylaria bambusicola]KAI0506235.1 putative ATP-binding cassette transporter [Xylaria bambusicola]
MDCTFAAEASFGPAVASCRRAFDFTLFFEELFFTLLPSALFLLVAGARVAVLLRAEPKTRLGVLYFAKIAAVVIFAALELTLLIVTCLGSGGRTSITVATAALSFVASVALIVLSHVEHVRSAGPSDIIGFYLVITALLRAAVVRTYRFIDIAIASRHFASLAVQLAVLALESWSKRRWLIDAASRGNPEECASFLSTSLFAWVNRLFFVGYRRQLTESDLRIIDSSLKTSELEPSFNRILVTKKFGRHGLITLTFRSLGLYAFAPVLPRLALSTFTFTQPFLASSLIEFLEGGRDSSQNNGYGLIGATFLVYTGIAIATGWYYYVTYRMTTKVRGGLIMAISHKMLKIKQEKGAGSKVLTLIIGDLQRITTALGFAQEIWIAPIETGVGLWLLWRQVGPSSLTVLGIVLICTVASVYIGKHSAVQQRAWMGAIEKRIQATKHMLSSLKAIKMTGADSKAAAMITRLRELEFEASKSFRRLLVAGLFSSFVTLTLSPVVVFGTYIGATAAQSRSLDPNRLFSSLILINLVANPLVVLLQTFSHIGAAIGCFTRIQDFLQSEELSDPRERIPIYDGTADGQEKRDPMSGPLEPVIEIINGWFSWDDKVLVKDVNLSVGKGDHVVITGPVGSGKSLLLQAIIGEAQPRSGKIRVKDNIIAFCGQNPWVENSAVRDNVVRGAPDDEIWRERVVHACALRELFDAKLPSETVGSNGARISGGERQRLALARAVALRPSVILLDDVFSAIDRTTKKHILENLFGTNGLLTQLGTTVIQVTQDWQSAQFADTVVAIEDGSLVPYTFPEPDHKVDQVPDPAQETKAPSGDPKGLEKGNAEKERGKKKTVPTVIVGDRQVYRTYFGSFGATHVTIFFAISIIFAFTLRFPAVWVQFWSADESNPSSRNHTTGYWIGLYAFLSALPLATSGLWAGHLILTIIPKSGTELHNRLLKAVINTTFVFVSGIDTGDLINRFNQDLQFIDVRLPTDLINAVSSLLDIIAQTILIAVAAVYVLAAVPVVFAALFLIQHVYLRTSKQLRQLDLQSNAGLQAKASETYAGLSTIRAHGWQSMMLTELRGRLDRTQEPNYLLLVVQSWLRLVLALLVAGLSVVVVGVAVATRRAGGGAIGVAFLNLVTLGSVLTNFISSWTSLETSLGAIARIEAFEHDTPTEPRVSSPVEVSPNWPERGDLKIENLHASYTTDDSTDPAWGLRDISLHIKAGERVAVCGRTGSGKSTLLLSLLALIDCPKGRVLLDDIDISRVPRSLLRSRFHVVSQDTFSQGESVRDALDPEGSFSDESIEEVLRECAIIDNIIAAGGLKGNLSGANFSAGEEQLFVLARTILRAGGRPGGVILLDEATSSIDVATEKKIMAVIGRKLQGKTVISVLHRLETALEYGRIVVLEDGRVVHFGSPAEILRDSELFSTMRK